MDATLAQVRSRSDLMSMKLAARMSSNNISCSTSTNAASQAGTTSFILLLLRGLSMSGIFFHRVMFAELDHFGQHFSLNVGERNFVVFLVRRAGASTLFVLTTDHHFDQLGHHGNLPFNLKLITAVAHKSNLCWWGHFSFLG